MTVRLSRGASVAAALVSCVAVILPFTGSAQVGPATPQWSTYLGGTDTDRINAITQLSDGQVVIVGTTSSQNLTPTPPPSGPRSTGADVFVARCDSDGYTIPEFPFLVLDGAGTEEVTAAALGPNDELYIVGKTTSMTIAGTTNFRAPTASGNVNAFLARISATGTPDWFLFLSGSGDDVATGVTVAGGNVYVSGWTASTDFLGRSGGFPLQTNGFVVQVQPTATAATLGWNQIIGGSGDDTLRGITWDQGSRLLVVGTTTSVLMYPNLALNNHGGGSDAFVISLELSSGAPQWLTFVGGSSNDEGNAIATGSQQSFVVAGTTSSNLGGPPPPPGKNAFVMWFNAEGARRLIQVRGGAADDEALTVTTDSYGTAYVGGRTASSDFSGTSNGFDSMIETGSTLREGFVWMAPPQGGDGWASYLGGPGTDAVKSLSLRASNRLILGLDTDSSSGLPGPFIYDSSASSPPDGYILSVSVNDLVPPSPVGEVFDRLQLDDVHEDVEETLSTTSLFANWTAFNDSQTGIARYDWAIGTEQNPTLVQPFTSVGTQQSAMATGLTLTLGTKYIVTVRAQNPHGLTAIARSNGITVVSPPPPDGGTGGTDGGTGGTDGGTGGTDGGTGGTDGGTGGTDGGTGADGGSDGKDGGTGTPDAGGEDIEEPDKGPASPVGWDLGCASAGGAGLPLLLGLFALVLLRRRLGQQR